MGAGPQSTLEPAKCELSYILLIRRQSERPGIRVTAPGPRGPGSVAPVSCHQDRGHYCSFEKKSSASLIPDQTFTNLNGRSGTPYLTLSMSCSRVARWQTSGGDEVSQVAATSPIDGRLISSWALGQSLRGDPCAWLRNNTHSYKAALRDEHCHRRGDGPRRDTCHQI